MNVNLAQICLRIWIFDAKNMLYPNKDSHTLGTHTHTHTARRSGLFIGTYVRVERTFSCPYSCLRLTGNIRLFLARSLPPTFSHSQLPHLNFSLLPCPPLSLSVCLHHIFISLCRTALLRALAYRDPFHAAEVHSGCRL